MMKTTLERIREAILKQHPAGEVVLQPGLSQGELEATLRGFPYRLPEEALSLYLWADGNSEGYELFPGYSFLPLKRALEEYRINRTIAESLAAESGEEAASFWNEQLLPLFELERDYYAIETATEALETAPLFLVSHDETTSEPEYSRLRDLLQAVAELYEAGAYRVQEGRYAEGGSFYYLLEDEPIAEPVYARYRLPTQATSASASQRALFEAVKGRYLERYPQEPFMPFPKTRKQWHKFYELQSRVDRQEQVSELADGGKRVVTEWLNGSRSDVTFDAQGRPTVQLEYLQSELISRTERRYRDDSTVLIRRETFVGQPQVTEAVAHVDEKGTLRDVRTIH